MAIELTRNFCIIAHIDHGKTTLSDRLLECTGTIHEREKQDQLLDSMDLERERGITIKAHPVTMRYTSKSGETYQLNLLDTPGHVDFAFDVYRGVVGYVRVVSGTMEANHAITLMNNNARYEIKEVGVFTPKMLVRPKLNPGDVGYFIANIKTTADIKIGDTITDQRHPASEPLPGFQEIHPMVFSGIYPINTGDFEHLKVAIGKLRLNDAAFVYQPESSVALGFGFRCGFLGLLHMEIIQERLRREYNMDIIATSPSVVYEVLTTRGEKLLIDNPAHLPNPSMIQEIREPIVKAYVLCPNENIGDLLQLILEKRGQMDHTESLDTRRVMLHCELPLNEILVDFNDKIKTITRGYGSMDYEHAGYRAAKLVKLDLLVNGEPVDAFSTIVHKDRAEARGRQLAAKLKEVIPRQLYQVAIQAAIGGKIIARESVSALRKNVTAKCYGGDITRKRKLLEKQKEGKKRMKSIGKINIPQEAFIEVLKAQ